MSMMVFMGIGELTLLPFVVGIRVIWRLRGIRRASAVRLCVSCDVFVRVLFGRL